MLSSDSEEASTSRVVEYRTFDRPEVLKEAERPAQAPGDGEVYIAVCAVELNPPDFKTFRGGLRRLERAQHILHPRRWPEGASIRSPRGVTRDPADVIDAVGANVTDLAVGNAVLGILRSAPGQADTRGAPTTELVAPVDDVIKKSAPLPFTQAVCPDVAAQTAYGAFKQLNVYEGDVIVISVATGGVGSVTPQLAVSRGTTVIGTAGACNIDYLRSLGAIPIAHDENLTSRICDVAPSPVTKFPDCYGGIRVRLGRDLGLTGRSIGALVLSPMTIARDAQLIGSRHSNGRGDLEEMVELVTNDTTKIELAHIYSFTLEQIRATYTESAKGHIHGKFVIDLS